MTDYNIVWNTIDVNHYAPKVVDLSSLKWPKGWPLPRVGEIVSNGTLNVRVRKVEWVIGVADPYIEFGVEVRWASRKVLLDADRSY